jgi:2-polyprenyl-6-methoxyphenol hydroxylase and related FAD-dependent oxidoreductases
MAPLKILICGGGIAGPALAFWLSKLGHDVTVIERFPSLRVSGQQLDLRGPGIPVMKRMGLEDRFDSQSIKEAGMQFVDDHGKRRLSTQSIRRVRDYRVSQLNTRL